MIWIWRLLLILIVLGALAFVGFAYFGDLSPPREDVREPVVLESQ